MWPDRNANLESAGYAHTWYHTWIFIWYDVVFLFGVLILIMIIYCSSHDVNMTVINNGCTRAEICSYFWHVEKKQYIIYYYIYELMDLYLRQAYIQNDRGWGYPSYRHSSVPGYYKWKSFAHNVDKFIHLIL